MGTARNPIDVKDVPVDVKDVLKNYHQAHTVSFADRLLQSEHDDIAMLYICYPRYFHPNLQSTKMEDERDQYILQLQKRISANEKLTSRELFWLGYGYHSGYGVDLDSKLACDYYLRASNQNDLFAKVNYANILLNDKSKKIIPDIARALTLLTDAATQGNVLAMNRLGVVHPNTRTSRHWYRKAVEMHFPFDLLHLATKECADKTVRLNHIAEVAKTGFHEALIALGIELLEDKSHPQNYENAILIMKTSEGTVNESRSLYLLGKLFQSNKDFVKAAICYRIAANRDHVEAQYKLVEMNIDLSKLINTSQQTKKNSFEVAFHESIASGSSDKFSLLFRKNPEWFDELVSDSSESGGRLVNRLLKAEELAEFIKIKKESIYQLKHLLALYLREHKGPVYLILHYLMNSDFIYEDKLSDDDFLSRAIDAHEISSWQRANQFMRGNHCAFSYLLTPENFYRNPKRLAEENQDNNEMVKRLRESEKKVELSSREKILTGMACLFGNGVAVDRRKAVEQYFKKALKDEPLALTMIGFASNLNNDSKTADEWCQRAIESKEPVALLNMAFKKAAQQDIVGYLHHMKLAAELRMPLAFLYLAEHYHSNVQYENAWYYFNKAALEGLMTGISWMAYMIFHGQYVPKNMSRAIKFYTVAAAYEAVACQRLSEIYEDLKENAKAKFYLEKAKQLSELGPKNYANERRRHFDFFKLEDGQQGIELSTIRSYRDEVRRSAP